MILMELVMHVVIISMRWVVFSILVHLLAMVKLSVVVLCRFVMDILVVLLSMMLITCVLRVVHRSRKFVKLGTVVSILIIWILVLDMRFMVVNSSLFMIRMLVEVHWLIVMFNKSIGDKFVFFMMTLIFKRVIEEILALFLSCIEAQVLHISWQEMTIGRALVLVEVGMSVTGSLGMVLRLMVVHPLTFYFILYMLIKGMGCSLR